MTTTADTLVILVLAGTERRAQYAAACARAGVEVDVLTIPPLGLSSAYDRLARDIGGDLDKLVQRYPLPAGRALASYTSITMAFFSAGYGLVRGLSGASLQRITGYCSLDSIHGDQGPDGKATSAGVAPFSRIAGRARAGKCVFTDGHTDVDPVSYASTTETIERIIADSGGPLPASELTDADRRTGIVSRHRSSWMLVEAYDRRAASQAAQEHSDALSVWGPELVAWTVAADRIRRQGGEAPPRQELKPEPLPTAPMPLDWASGIEGIDVSGNQNRIVWPTVAAAGIRFVCMRVSMGVDWLDPWLAEYARESAAAGIAVRSGYHVVMPRRGAQDAAKQAQQFCAAYRKHGLNGIPWLDVEPHTGTTGLPIEKWELAVRDARHVIEGELGARPILYTYPGFWDPAVSREDRSKWRPRKWLSASDEWAEMPLAIAHYTPQKPIIPRPWDRPLIWQYAAGAGVLGRVPGVQGYCDRDRLYGTLEALMLPGTRPAA